MWQRLTYLFNSYNEDLTMKLLLVEDDIKHCDLYKTQIAKAGHVNQLWLSYGAKDGLSTYHRQSPDIILLDLELNKSDGNGIDFLKELQAIRQERLAVIVITNVESEITHMLAHKYGADFILTKANPVYSPGYAIGFACEFYMTAYGTSAAIPKRAIQERIEEKLDALGSTFDMSGRKYLIEAIHIVSEIGIEKVQLKRDVYPQIARKYKKSDDSIERAIDNAIKKAWRISDWSTLIKHYSPQTNYLKGIPTIKEFIFFVVESLRKETRHDYSCLAAESFTEAGNNI